MRVLLLIIAVVTVLYVYAWQKSLDPHPPILQSHSVYSDSGTLSLEGQPC